MENERLTDERTPGPEGGWYKLTRAGRRHLQGLAGHRLRGQDTRPAVGGSNRYDFLFLTAEQANKAYAALNNFTYGQLMAYPPARKNKGAVESSLRALRQALKSGPVAPPPAPPVQPAPPAPPVPPVQPAPPVQPVLDRLDKLTSVFAHLESTVGKGITESTAKRLADLLEEWLKWLTEPPVEHNRREQADGS